MAAVSLHTSKHLKAILEDEDEERRRATQATDLEISRLSSAIESKRTQASSAVSQLNEAHEALDAARANRAKRRMRIQVTDKKIIMLREKEFLTQSHHAWKLEGNKEEHRVCLARMTGELAEANRRSAKKERHQLMIQRLERLAWGRWTLLNQAEQRLESSSARFDQQER